MEFITFLPKLFIWWYGQGIKDFFAFFVALFGKLQKTFSFGRIIKTFFAPWKKLIFVAWPRDIYEIKDWLLDNFISRGVGMVMRTALLVLALLCFAACFVFFVVAAVFWIFMPLIFVTLIVYIFSL